MADYYLTQSGATIQSLLNKVEAGVVGGLSGVISNVKNDSTINIASSGIVDVGVYVVFLFGYVAATDTASVYAVRCNSTSQFYVTALHEGTNANAPRISSSGILTLNTSTTARSVDYASIKLA